MGTSLEVQWLRLHASIAGGMGSIPGGGTKILHAVQPGQKKKANYECHYFIKHLSPFIRLKEGQVVKFNPEIMYVGFCFIVLNLSFVYTVYLKVTIVCLQCCLR